MHTYSYNELVRYLVEDTLSIYEDKDLVLFRIKNSHRKTIITYRACKRLHKIFKEQERKSKLCLN